MLTDAFVSTTFMRNLFFVKIIKIPIPFFVILVNFFFLFYLKTLRRNAF